MKRLVRDCPSVDNILDSRKEVLLRFWGLGGCLKLLIIHKILENMTKCYVELRKFRVCCERGFLFFGFSKWQGKGVSGIHRTSTYLCADGLVTDLMNLYGVIVVVFVGYR